MNIQVNIEGSISTYTDETPIKEIRGLFEYFATEVGWAPDVDTMGLPEALLLHKDAKFEDLQGALEYYYPKEEDKEYIPRIQRYLDIAEELYFRLKSSLKEEDFWFFMRNYSSADLIPNVQKDAIQTMKQRIDNLDIETLFWMHPDIPIETVIKKTEDKKMEEYSFYRETITRIYQSCIGYTKNRNYEIANWLFGILKKTSLFKNTIKGHGEFSLIQKQIPKTFGFPEYEPAIMNEARNIEFTAWE